MIFRVFPDDKNDIKDLKDFYENVYVKCFPNEDERESFENILYYLNESDNHEDYTYYIFLYKDYDTKEVQGGIIFDCFFDSYFGVLEFLAVKPNCQSKGIGDKLYRTAYNILYSYEVRYIFGEIEKPEVNTFKVKKYLNMWRSRGYKKICFNYIQPSLSKDKLPVEVLDLIVLDMNEKSLKQYIDREVLINCLCNFFNRCFGIKRPRYNKHFKQMYNSCYSDFVELKDIE